MTRVILVRHAEPQIDIDVPSAEWRLTPRGMSSTEQLAAVLASLGPTLIVASPERKAVETGRILADALGIPLEEDACFSEQEAEPGQFLADNSEFRAFVRSHFDHPDEIVMRQESSHSARERFAAAIRLRFPEHPSDEAPVIVSHGRIMVSWLGALTSVSAWDVWTELRMPDLIEVDLEQRTYHSIDIPLV